MNEIVKYNNYMNNLRFTGFTSVDFNFLMVLCNKLRDKDVSEIVVSFEELREKTGYKQTSVAKFVTDLKRMNKKLMGITCTIETETEVVMFVLFPTFTVNISKQSLTIAVNEKFKFLLNELIKNFTRFELDEFVKIESKYCKNLYRLLKQFRSTGKFRISVGNFREKMDCPVSYTNKHIMDKIIKPSLKELQNYFQNLKCEAEYDRKPGRPVIGYIFTFTPETTENQSEHGNEKAKTIDKNQKFQNGFANFHQREYDFDQLEKEILSRCK